MKIKRPKVINAYIPQVIKEESDALISRYWGKPSLPSGYQWPVKMRDEYLDIYNKTENKKIKYYPGLFYAQFLVSDLPEEVKKLLPCDAGMILIFTRYFTINVIVLSKNELTTCIPTEMPQQYKQYIYDDMMNIEHQVESYVLKQFILRKEWQSPYSEDEIDNMDDNTYKEIIKKYNILYNLNNIDFPTNLIYRTNNDLPPHESINTVYAEDKFLGADFFENNDRDEVPVSYRKLFQITGSGPLGYNNKINNNYFYGTGNIFINKKYKIKSFASCD